MPPVNHHSSNPEILNFWKTWNLFSAREVLPCATEMNNQHWPVQVSNGITPIKFLSSLSKGHYKGTNEAAHQNLCKWFILPTIQPSLRNKKIFLQIWFEDSIHMPFEKLSQTLGGTTTPWPGNLAKSVLFQSIPNQAGYHLPVMRNKPNWPVTRTNTPSPKWGNL